MRAARTMRRRPKEAGIALLIAIFVLLLIAVVAIALVVSSGTESALAGNYRSSTGVYYSALAGVEEIRARLRTNDPNSFKNTWGSFYVYLAAGATLPVGTVGYVLNPGPNDTYGNMLTAYPDQQYDIEFGPGALGSATKSNTPSVWNRAPLNGLPFPGPLYKWVRINAVSEKSLNLDVDADGLADSITPLYYSGGAFSNNQSAGPQTLELTALAVLPNGSQKILQYLVAPAPITLPPFLAALTLSGSNSPGGNPSFQAPANNTQYGVIGNDQDCNGNPTAGTPVYALGLFGDYTGGSYATDIGNLVNGNGTATGIPAAPPSIRQNNYPGLGGTNPDVQYLTGYPVNLESPSQLDAIVQTITQNADVVLPSGPVNYPLPTVSGPALNSLGMSATNPMTVVINGNLDVTNWTGTGYGTLVVIGNFTYDPAATWNGIVLVIGQGQINNIDHGQYQQMNGAVFVAKTRDPGGNLLGGKIGGGSVTFDPPMQGNGIRYSSCWIQRAQPTSGYKILSFHEISQ